MSVNQRWVFNSRGQPGTDNVHVVKLLVKIDFHVLDLQFQGRGLQPNCQLSQETWKFKQLPLLYATSAENEMAGLLSSTPSIPYHVPTVLMNLTQPPGSHRMTTRRSATCQYWQALGKLFEVAGLSPLDGTCPPCESGKRDVQTSQVIVSSSSFALLVLERRGQGGTYIDKNPFRVSTPLVRARARASWSLTTYLS